MSSGGSRRRRSQHEEEHENSERWLVTYADMLTVLMALFIVMFAISVVDAKKFDELKSGTAAAFGNGPDALDGGDGLLSSGSALQPVQAGAALTALQEQQQAAAEVRRERESLEKVKQQIVAQLKARGLQDSVRFELDDRGLTVTIVTDQVLFDLGSAVLREQGREVLDGITPAVRSLPNPVTIEGHTDSLPMRGTYASNWELSTARATTVLRYLVEAQRFPAKRIAAAGYADQRPVAPNTPQARAANRRVQVVVHALAVPPAPAVAAAVDRPAPPAPLVPDTTETASAAGGS